MKAFALLRAFRSVDEYLTSAELSRRAGLPEASGYRLIQTLESVGAVVRDGRGRYQPGFVTNAQAAELPDALSDAGVALLQTLAERFGATVHLGVLEDGMATYVVKAAAETSVHVPTRVSAQQEAYCSAIGKVLLAALSPSELDCFLAEGDLVALTEHTITDPSHFRDELAGVRRNGFALDRGEAHPHLGCVALPVCDEYGATVAAVSLVDRIEALTERRRIEACQALSQAAGSISRNLGELARSRPVSTAVWGGARRSDAGRVLAAMAGVC